jgi:uncharacterized membrane protein
MKTRLLVEVQCLAVISMWLGIVVSAASIFAYLDDVVKSKTFNINQLYYHVNSDYVTVAALGLGLALISLIIGHFATRGLNQ